jgi:hypothetical protein
MASCLRTYVARSDTPGALGLIVASTRRTQVARPAGTSASQRDYVIPLIGRLAAHPAHAAVVRPSSGHLIGGRGSGGVTLASQSAMNGGEVDQSSPGGSLVSADRLATLVGMGKDVIASLLYRVLTVRSIPGPRSRDLPSTVFGVVSLPIPGVVPRMLDLPRLGSTPKGLLAAGRIGADFLVGPVRMERRGADDARPVRYRLTALRFDFPVPRRTAVRRTDLGLTVRRTERLPALDTGSRWGQATIHGSMPLCRALAEAGSDCSRPRLFYGAAKRTERVRRPHFR